MNPLNNKKIPITRLTKWYDETDFALDIDMGREYFEGDNNFTVVLYQVDRQKTNYDDIYGETLQDELRFQPPVELKVSVQLDSNDMKTYNSSNATLSYKDYGNLTFIIYTKQLDEKKCKINIGDFVAYADREDNVKYFKVVDDDRINSENAKTIGGYKAFYKKIVCVTTDLTEFRGV